MIMYLHKKISFLGLVFVFLSFSSIAFGQGKFTVTGVVSDETGSPVIGANIMLKNTALGTITDVDGMYTLTGSVVDGTYQITVSYLGYSNVNATINISGGSRIVQDFSLRPDALFLDEVVVTGTSANSTRRQLGNSISVVKAESLEKAGTTNALGALQGKVMGAQITQNSGDPAGGISVRLRGASSVNGSSQPLYVIDGIIVDNSSQNVINRNADAMGTSFSAGQNRLVDINPNDIERIEILSGASAAALYGARAGNGVIQIFTKRGSSQKTKIQYNTSMSISSLRNQVPMTEHGRRFGTPGNPRLETTQDRLTILLNLGRSDAVLTDQGVGFVKAGNAGRTLVTDQYDAQRYNYWDEIFQTAFGTENNLSFSGGTEKTKYFASLGYYDNEGILKNTNFKKYNFRLNLDQELASWAKLSMGLSGNLSRSKDMPNGNNFFNPISSVFIIDNVWDITERDANGQLRQVEAVRMNPLTPIETFDIRQNTHRTMGNIKLSLFPLDGLTVDIIGGGDLYSLQGNEYYPRVPYPGVAASFFPDGYISLASDNVMLLNQDLNITYQKDISSKLKSTSMVGYQIMYNKNQYTAQDGRDVAPFGTTISAANNIFGRPVQRIAERLISGVFASQTLGYNDEIYVTVAARMDRSSVFAIDNQNIVYPKISASWVLNDYIQNKSILSSAKLRAAYGQAGNLTGIGAYDRFDNYALSANGGFTTIIPPRVFANPSVRPERLTELEFGGDFAFLNNRIGLSVNMYNQKTTDLLLTKPVAPSIGGTNIVTNVSSDSTYIQNRGIEIMLNANVFKTKDMNWNIGAIYSRNDNKVFGIDGGFFYLRGGDGAQAVLTGHPFGAFYGTYYARDNNGDFLLTPQGLFQPERGVQTTVLEGDVKRGADGQPLTTGTGSTELRQVIGSPIPKWTGSLFTDFTYKKLSFNVLFDAVMGFDVYNWNRITSNNVGWGPLAERELKGEVPRGTVASVAGGINGGRIMQEHVEDGSFVKLRELGISYELGKIIGVCENLSVGITGRNLLSFDNYQGFDPEVNSAGQSDRVRGDDFGALPIPRSFIFRLGITF